MADTDNFLGIIDDIRKRTHLLHNLFKLAEDFYHRYTVASLWLYTKQVSAISLGFILGYVVHRL